MKLVTAATRIFERIRSTATALSRKKGIKTSYEFVYPRMTGCIFTKKKEKKEEEDAVRN